MELLDVYNEEGKKTGKVVKRGSPKEAYEEGEHIAVAIIFIENSKHEFLIQKTSKEKGGEYSSTGGHVNHKEEPIQTIIREVKEEIGIDISNDNVIDLGYLLFDFPLRFVFYLKKDIDLEKVKCQKEEVESVSYKTEKEIKELIKKGFMHKAHAKVFEYILKKINS